jgi:hypothetical protein
MNGRANAHNYTMLRAVGDKSEANQAVRQLVVEGKLTKEEAKMAIVHDRAMKPTERAAVNTQDNISLGRMFYHKRSEQQLIGIDGLAEISDPVEAMIKNIDSTSKYVANFDLLSTMKKRWMNTFGTKYGLTKSDDAFPGQIGDIGPHFTGTGQEKLQAIEMWEHIRRTESISTKEGELWRDSMIRLADDILVRDTAADTISGKFWQIGAKPFRFMANHSPFKMMRSLAFHHLIAMNPFRQAYVQAQQAWFIAALAPKEFPKIMMQNKAVMMGLLKDVNPKLYNLVKDPAAKAMGMSSKEYDDFMRMFNETGIPHSVDSHDFVQKALVEYSNNLNGGLLKNAGRKVWNAAVAPAKYMKRVGFDYGERSNLISSFLIARVRYLKQTGKKALKTKEDFAKTAADARNIALDMTQSGAFRYQDGALSALTQFMSIQHKAMMAMAPWQVLNVIPGINIKAANQAFSQADRIRITVGQLLLNGATGLGLYELYRKAQAHFDVQINPELDDIVVGGLYETVINEAIELATGDAETDLNISGSIAPASGITQSTGFFDAVIGHKSILDSFAATNVINRYTDAARTIQAMYQHPDLTDDDQLVSMMSAFGSVTSGWNQWLRGRAARRLGVHVTNSGSPTVQATFMSSWSEGLLGIQARSMEDYYQLTDQYSNEITTTVNPFGDADRETTEAAKNLYRQMNRIVTLFQDEFDPNIAGLNAPQLERLHLQRMQAALSMQASILAIYDPIERDRIWNKFNDLAVQDRVHGRTSLIDNIIKKVWTGDLTGRNAQSTINRLRASGLYDPETPEGQLIEFNITNVLNSINAQNQISDDNLKTIEGIYNGKD